ncbi:hypothetical protein SC09_contig4orf00820 [Bacillus subtilis]|uniref:Uncharacterized protein n=1 Tax=Bacillus subtilis TaxID=1423 RepID=A0A0D1KBY8_BACIU|nr:hypothetical protein SC09_contig4orf00820 [Bacillus subtilis]
MMFIGYLYGIRAERQLKKRNLLQYAVQNVTFSLQWIYVLSH